MAEQSYNYTVADDMPGGKVNPSKLRLEIEASSIVTALERISTVGGTLSQGVVTGGTLSIVFKEALSSGDKTTLDGDTSDPAGGLLAAHDNSPSPLRAEVCIINTSEQIVNWPMTSGDGDATKMTPISNPNILTPGYLFYATGSFDDITNDLRGQGTFMEIEQDGVGVSYIEGQFLEHVYMHGGSFGVHNEGKSDWVQMLAYAPASSPSNVPGGTGNANKVGYLTIDNKSGTFQAGEVLSGGTSGHTAAIAAVVSATILQVAHIGTGAFQDDEEVTGATSGATADVNGAIAINMFVPASGNGFWNVDGSTRTHGEINDNLAPVPNSDEAGYWNWTVSADPSITPANGDGSYDLYDQPIPLVRQANRIGCLLHEKDCCPEALKGKKMLPHWKIRFYASRASSGTLLVQFLLKTSRKTTTNMGDLS